MERSNVVYIKWEDTADYLCEVLTLAENNRSVGIVPGLHALSC